MRILGSIFLYFFLFLSLSSNAQISIGIKGGPDFSKLINAVKGADANGNIATLNSGTVTQFYGGVFVDIPLDTGKMFYLRPGVNYIGAGGNMNATGNYYTGNGFVPSTKYTLHYVDVPVEFVYSPGFGWGRPWVGFGFYGGALINGTIKTQGSSSRSVIIGNKPTDDFQRYDFGYTFSMGLATKVGFLFGVDYQHGFLRVVPASSEQSNQPRLQTRNAVWGLHVGWLFKL
ncbi:MAG TPA: porin family protein [Puia sp.]|jgi:hypothetical protein|nr:porin family protein [Puia sp.]